ncbi:hypothetical protein C2E21_9466 [Chlorella sorokiniana]|uniref:Uncharacterized protein n=1 Tax=Chlorella sorokiniana TaxID=3076 RepID=A0A2P6TBA6_CHLSO|nr:hypothetical protein C2E21_9466 [Chlorella sorokiniana]|eukprot:PRW05835.1 hypothetical protein C2E21_9466 [Chlorella sorokiniana]
MTPRPAAAAAGRTMSAAVGSSGHRGGVEETIPPTVHQTAASAPGQPEVLFRPDLGPQAQGGKPSEGGPEREELPFPNIPKPDYDAERPQEQTAPEPDNPLPPDLPPNWRPNEVSEWAAPKGPDPEVPMPRRSEPEMPQFPPDIVPMPSPAEMPARQPETEVPTSTPTPEFSPGAPSELPDRGGSEINFPGH